MTKFENRMYSAEQIVNLNNLFLLRYKGLKALHAHGRGEAQEDRRAKFFADVRAVFYEKKLLPREWFLLGENDEQQGAGRTPE
jgi:hypothetical protein